jgi:type I restriction enzyme S subunit
MSRLEELIQELCPDGIEYKALSEIGTMIRGNGLQKKDFTESGVGCIHYGQIYTYYGAYAYETKSFVSYELAKKLQKVNTGDLIIAVTSENIEDVCKCVAWLGDKEIVTGGHSVVFKHNQDARYLSYYFQTEEFYAQKRKISNGTKVIEVHPQKLAQVVVPVPPLPVQREIVRILDNISELTTELTAELTAELTLRRKQYEYYRSKLLTFGDDVPIVKLGDIADFKYGFTDTAKEQGAARFIRITDIGDNGKLLPGDNKYIDLTKDSEKYLLEKGDLLMARTGATYGKTMMFNDDVPAIYASFLIRIRFPENTVLPNYYWHFARSDLYWNQANKLVSKAGQPQFNANVLKAIVIPIPPVEEQTHIVAILNRFDVLSNGISTGLHTEIEERGKQYEHYRDKLLSFQEVTTA